MASPVGKKETCSCTLGCHSFAKVRAEEVNSKGTCLAIKIDTSALLNNEGISLTIPVIVLPPLYGIFLIAASRSSLR